MGASLPDHPHLASTRATPLHPATRATTYRGTALPPGDGSMAWEPGVQRKDFVGECHWEYNRMAESPPGTLATQGGATPMRRSIGRLRRVMAGASPAPTMIVHPIRLLFAFVNRVLKIIPTPAG